MVESDNLRYTRIALNNGSGAIPALGFGTLIPDTMATRTATKAALEAGFRQLDASERYRNEKGVTTGSTSSRLLYCAVEPLIFALHMECPEVVPLPIEVSRSQIQHCLCA